MLRKRHRFADTADAFYALMLLRLYCWCSDAADALMLLMCWCWGCAAAADALMHCTDALMMLMCWCCWYNDAADVPMLMCQFSCTGAKGSHHVRKTVKKADNVRTGRGGVYPSSLILASFYQALKSLGNGLSTLTNWPQNVIFVCILESRVA